MRLTSTFCLLLAAAAGAHGSPLTLDPAQSAVDISVKSTIDSFVAHLTAFDGKITSGTSAGEIESAVFQFNFAAIKTGNTERDRAMNDWQQTAEFPQVVFTLATLEPAAGGQWRARGQLKFHGVERTVNFPISIQTDPADLVLLGDVLIDTRNYGLPVIRKLLALKVDPIVHVHFCIFFR